MADEIPPYPYQQPNYAQYAPAPIYSPPQPMFEAPPVQQRPKAELECDFCGEEIVEGEECLNWLYGVAGPGRKSGRRMVQASAEIPEGEVNLHIHCVSGFVEDSLPEAADEIRQNFNYGDDVPPDEIFCANCDAKIEDYNAG